MNTRVANLFSRLQEKHRELLSELDKVAPEILETSPEKNKWSITQVMYHLHAAESNSVLYVSKKRLGAAQLKPTGIIHQLTSVIARLAFILPVKFNAPKVLGAMPEQVNYQEIKKSWIETRDKLSELLESLPDDELRKPIFRQPFFGYWNIFQMLQFMNVHFNRHRMQILRTVKKIKK